MKRCARGKVLEMGKELRSPAITVTPPRGRADLCEGEGGRKDLFLL